MLTVEDLRKNIIDLLSEAINDKNSEIYTIISQIANSKINTLIEEDNENDINWDEIDELFDEYNYIGGVTFDNNNYYVSVDTATLNEGEEYTLKYVDADNNELSSFEKITSFIA